MNQIYKKDKFIIVPFFKKNSSTEYMIVNTEKQKRKGFKLSHTHIKSFKMGKYLIELAIHKRINNGLSPYLLRSIIRITDDQKFTEDLEELIAVKKQKGKKLGYRNCK